MFPMIKKRKAKGLKRTKIREERKAASSTSDAALVKAVAVLFPFCQAYVPWENAPSFIAKGN